MTQKEMNQTEWENPDNWTGPRWLSIYFSKKDSRCFVPKQIKALGPMEVEISIHGARPETHDALTRIKGSFVKTLAGVRNLVDAGIKVNLKCPIMKLNKDELYEVRDLADDLGLFITFDPVILRPSSAKLPAWERRSRAFLGRRSLAKNRWER